jgi:hypothetical protein
VRDNLFSAHYLNNICLHKNGKRKRQKSSPSSTLYSFFQHAFIDVPLATIKPTFMTFFKQKFLIIFKNSQKQNRKANEIFR